MNKLVIGILSTLLFLSTLTNIFFVYQNEKRNLVTSVPDGDSLQLADGQRIRLLSIDAPERDRCGASDARTRLTALIKNKVVRLTDTVTDDYGRTLANVWIGSTLVNETLVAEGLAKFTSVTSPYMQKLRAASSNAKNKQLGIYSPTCRQTDPTTECVIKGNKRASASIYFLPTCSNYDQVIVDTSFGDQWFCTEQDSIRAGFSKSKTCR